MSTGSCSRFVAADDSGPLDEDPCCSCGARYDEHAAPRGVACLAFASPAPAILELTPCTRCGESWLDHIERNAGQRDAVAHFGGG